MKFRKRLIVVVLPAPFAPSRPQDLARLDLQVERIKRGHAVVTLG
jgi:hypothetical protein